MVFHDITARKRAEAEYRNSEQRLRNLLDCLPQIITAMSGKPQHVALPDEQTNNAAFDQMLTTLVPSGAIG